MPTGVVSWDTVMWLGTVLVGAITGAGTVLTLAYNIFKSITDRMARVEADLEAYKLHVAETYATKAGMTTAVDRVESAVAQISQKVEQAVDRLSSRIDRLLELPGNRRRDDP